MPSQGPPLQDLQLAKAALRSQGPGGLYCRDALNRSVLHHAALGKAPQKPEALELWGEVERDEVKEKKLWTCKGNWIMSIYCESGFILLSSHAVHTAFI